MNYARWPRTEAEAFRLPEQFQAIHGPYRRLARIPEGVLYWAALILCVLAFVGLSGCISDTEADQAIAADKAQAPIDAAMVAFGSNVMEVMP